MTEPSLPRNSELVKDGQGSQPLMRFLDQVKRRAYTAIQSFNQMINLNVMSEAVDTSNDYLLIYNASANQAQRVTPSAIAPVPVLVAYDDVRSGITTNTVYSAGVDILTLSYAAADASNRLKVTIDIRFRATGGSGGGSATVEFLRNGTAVFELGNAGGGVGVAGTYDYHGSFFLSVPDTASYTYQIRWRLASGNISSFVAFANSLRSPLIIIEEFSA